MNGQGKSKKPPGFLASPKFQEISRESFARHNRTPDVSFNTYFAYKTRELQRELAGKKTIFLDTNHWINLRHVVMQSPLERPSYKEILTLLNDLHERQQICCPISFLLFEELMKQTDPVTRLNTARLMDRFSDGVCFQFPLELARNELRHFLLKRLPGLSCESKAWVWTKTGFFYGELFPTISKIQDATNDLIQKAWTDLMWAVGLENILEIIDSSDSGTDFWERYAVAANSDAKTYRSLDITYAKVLEREKAFLVRQLVDDELDIVSKEIWDAFPQCRNPDNLTPVRKSDYSPHNLPSLQILAGIVAADMLGGKKFNSHDMLDFRHAALAIPYCDAVCADHAMATRLRDKPCEFGKIYGTHILGRADEMFNYLKTL